MALRNQGTSPRVVRTASYRALSRSRAAAGLALLAALAAGGCDQPLDQAGAPVPQEPIRRKLAEIQIEFDPATQTLHTSIHRTPAAQPLRSLGGPRVGAPPGARFDELLDPYLTVESVWCDGCGTGNPDVKTVFVRLRNLDIDLPTLHVQSYSNPATFVNCTHLAHGPAVPYSITPSFAKVVSYSVDVVDANIPFSVHFSLFGTVEEAEDP
jgi:hypothetical protein